MRHLPIRLTLLSVFALAACSDRTPGTLPGVHEKGDEDFVSYSPNGGGYRGGGVDDANAPSAGKEQGGASSTPTREVVEADVYKVVGTTLYVLNAYRGLQILDISTPDSPRLISRLPLVGRPIDLYVRGTTAYVAVSDFIWWGWYEDEAIGTGVVANRGSRVWAVDVTKPSSPSIIARLPIEGDVEETRMVGDVLYVASRRYGWWDYRAGWTQKPDLTFVASFDVSNPKAMTQVDRLDFPANGWDTHANITVDRITLSQSGWRSQGPLTHFQVIDISDPAGKMVLGVGFDTVGVLKDRWGMDYDGSTGLFRAIVQQSWGNSGASIDLWRSPGPTVATKIGHLDLNINETLTASRFDDNRAYLVTARCSDPLWIVDTSNAAQPLLKGHLEIPGRLDFVEPRGDRLVAMGHDQAFCGGRGTMNVSLFDVADADKPALLGRVSFGGDYTNVNAQADDFRKVFQVIDAMGLILVPFEAWDRTSWTSKGGTQLVDFTRNSLTLRGFADHAGRILRAFPAGNRVMAFSDRSLQVLDISNRDAPRETAAIDLARPVATLTVVGDKTVQLAGDWYAGNMELTVTPKDDPEAQQVLARVKLAAPYARMYRDGDMIWVLARDWSSGNGTAWLQGVDVSDPANPVKRGRLDLDPNTTGYGYGYWGGWGEDTVLAGHALVFHPNYYDYWYDCWNCGGYTRRPDTVTVVDLSNPDAPALASSLTLPNSNASWGLNVSAGYVWVTHYEWVPNMANAVRYYVDRIDVSNPRLPRLLPKINVPGVFFGAKAGGTTFYTLATSYNSNWTQASTSLHELRLQWNGKARLENAVSVAGWSQGAALGDGFAWLQTQTYRNNTSRVTLSTVNLTGFGVTNSQDVAGSWAWLRKAAGGKLFVQSGGWRTAILVYDLAQPAAPAFDGYVFTEGYVNDIVVEGGRAYLPSGYYGVPMIDLTPGVLMPAQAN